MNQRIKELLKQATTTYISGMGERDEVDQEKFAELIVKECIGLALAADDPVLAVEIADLFNIQ